MSCRRSHAQIPAAAFWHSPESDTVQRYGRSSTSVRPAPGSSTRQTCPGRTFPAAQSSFRPLRTTLAAQSPAALPQRRHRLQSAQKSPIQISSSLSVLLLITNFHLQIICQNYANPIQNFGKLRGHAVMGFGEGENGWQNQALLNI